MEQALFNRFTIDMTLEQARGASHQGQCDEDVAALAQELNLSLDPEKVKAELREYGAWDAEELADEEQNLLRIVWIAASDIVEESQQEPLSGE